MNQYLAEIANLTVPTSVMRVVKSLQKKFRITVCKDVEKALELAVYLDALGCSEVSISFLESFIFDIKYSESSGVWGDKLDGLCLLARYYRSSGRKADYLSIFKIVESKNFDKSDTDWLVTRAVEDLEDYSDQSKYELVKNELTKKDRLLGHYWNIRVCNYYHEHLFFYRRSDQKELIKKLSSFIRSEQHALEEELKQ